MLEKLPSHEDQLGTHQMAGINAHLSQTTECERFHLSSQNTDQQMTKNRILKKCASPSQMNTLR